MSHLSFARRLFGLSRARPCPRPAKLAAPPPGEILAVLGPSGAGKTRALKALAARCGARFTAQLSQAQLASPVLSLFSESLPAEQVLRLLASCGLADATLWMRKAQTLSAGERRRLEIALALQNAARAPLIIDEFDAHLDSNSARCLAASLRLLATRLKLALVVSTHRPELLADLNPATTVEIDGDAATVRADLVAGEHVNLLDEVSIRTGSLGEYARFARWHYLGNARPGPVTDVFIAEHRGRAIAIAVFCSPHLFLSPRNLALPAYSSLAVRTQGANALNADVRLLARVVVEPNYRALGVASKLLRAALPRLGVRYVECLAEMGEFSGFLARAGFQKRGQVKPSREAQRVLKTLERLKISARCLASPRGREQALASLCYRERILLARQLKGLCRSRVETGKGSLRGNHSAAGEELLSRALLRIHCRPDYFLWEKP